MPFTGVSAARAVRGASIYSGGDRLRLADRYGYTPQLPPQLRRFPFGRPDRAMKMARHPLSPLPLYPLQKPLQQAGARPGVRGAGGGSPRSGAAAPR